jgi:hypothetical protein
MTRLPNWEQRLLAEVDAARAQPFRYGRHDCAAFVARCVLAVTGRDLFAPYEGRYHSRNGAARIVARAGGMAGLARAVFGSPLASPLQAQRGDVVLVFNDGDPALAVVMGSHAFAPSTSDRLAAVPMNDWRMAWRIE